MSGNWLNRFRELAKDISPDEYLFAEDREAFDQRRIWRRVSATLAICGLLLVAIMTSAYAAGWRVISPQRVAILETAETVVPNAAHWANERGPRRAKVDARVLDLIEQAQDAPQPVNTHAWISRYTDRGAPLTKAERTDALVALARYIELYDRAYWPAVVDSIMTVGALAGQPKLLDFFSRFWRAVAG